jgi:hypothetical protein
VGSCCQEISLREVARSANRKWYNVNVAGDLVCGFMFSEDKAGGGCACAGWKWLLSSVIVVIYQVCIADIVCGFMIAGDKKEGGCARADPL